MKMLNPFASIGRRTDQEILQEWKKNSENALKELEKKHMEGSIGKEDYLQKKSILKKRLGIADKLIEEGKAQQR